ncbi:hypothetical protein DFH06DRAFT_1342288 [Mycena polygramma]|nr:hypothetical protein DFH06DRAFT_1342288 [Mycena polygramma]
MSSPPPPYSESDELDNLVAGLDRLRLATPASPLLYHFASPAASGYTPHWSEAAAQSQCVPHGHASRMSPRPKRRRPKPQAYVVFFGLEPGPYNTWDEAWPLVDGVSGNLYQGYPNYPAADAAYEYAKERGWTRKCHPKNSLPTTTTSTTPAIPSLPQPAGLLDAPNPLHTGTTGTASPGNHWYVVYQGVTPGVYQSSLECGLNTVGLRGATHNSWELQGVAIAKFQEAVAAGSVKVLSPAY